MTTHLGLHRAVLTATVALAPIAASPQRSPANVAGEVQALANPDPEVRVVAAEALGGLGRGAAQAVPALIVALADLDAGVRWHAAVALAAIGPPSVAPLVRVLTGEPAARRAGAAFALGRMDREAADALRPLTGALGDPDAAVRENAAEALGRLGPEASAAVPAVVHLFSDPDPYVQGKAADAAAGIGPGAIPALVGALGERDPNVRWCAAIALGRLGAAAREAVPALTRALADGDVNVRWCATVALGAIGPAAAAAVGPLMEALHDNDEDVRWGANDALARIDPASLRGTGDWRAVGAAIEELTPALMKELHVPGVAIAVVADRRVVWTRSYGVADVRNGTPVTGSTLFEACSMSKPVFAYLVMKLVESGALDLDRPLSAYLPEADPPAQPEKDRITARMVLAHTSGLPNWRKGDEEREGPLPVKFEPGTRFSYSGEGVFYLQRVVERIAGEPLEVLARRRLFRPLGLVRTEYVWTPELEPDLASGHDAEGRFLKRTRYTHANAAYSLYTTAAGYAEFLVEMMRADRSASHSLTRASIDAMVAHQVALDAREPIERPGLARGVAVFWGLGWSINTTPGGDIVHHSGSNRSGFRCFSQFSPSRGSGIVIMTNGAGGGELWTRLISRVGDL